VEQLNQPAEQRGLGLCPDKRLLQENNDLEENKAGWANMKFTPKS
jgi:hypothetical protein